MSDWSDSDDDYWYDDDFWYEPDSDHGLVGLADDLAGTSISEPNWFTFLCHPSSRDLEEDTQDWLLDNDIDPDEYYDRDTSTNNTKTSPITSNLEKGKTASIPKTSTIKSQKIMDEHEQFPDSRKDDSLNPTTTTTDVDPIIEDTPDLDPELIQKKRTAAVAVLHDHSLLSPEGKRLRSQGTATPGGRSTPRNNNAIPNPNIGPREGEKLEVVFEDDKKWVVLVDTGGITFKLRTILKGPNVPHPLGNQSNQSPPTDESEASNPTGRETAQLIIAPPSNAE